VGEEKDGLDESSPYVRKKLKDKKQMGTIHRAPTLRKMRKEKDGFPFSWE